MSTRSVAPSLVLWLFPLVIVVVVGALLAGIAVLATSIDSATFGVRMTLWVVAPLLIAVWVAARQARQFGPNPRTASRCTRRSILRCGQRSANSQRPQRRPPPTAS